MPPHAKRYNAIKNILKQKHQYCLIGKILIFKKVVQKNGTFYENTLTKC